MSHWDGSGNPYDWTENPRRRLWTPALFVVVALLLTVGVAYGVIRLTRDEPPTDSLPAGDAAPVFPGGPAATGPGAGPAGTSTAGAGTARPSAPGAGAPGGGAPSGTAGTPPADAVLLARCRAGVDPADQAKAQASRVRAVFADQDGYLGWIGTTGFDRQCAYRWDGSPDDRQVDGLSVATTVSTDYLDGTGGVGPLVAGSQVRGRDRIMTIDGVVSRDVRRVVVGWADRPATQAVVHEQFFLARRIEPDGAAPSSPIGDGCVLQAYNAHGQMVARRRC
jgi:hypothetical protein